MKISIKQCNTNNVLFETEISDNIDAHDQMRAALEAAVKVGANLGRAYLVDAYLGGTNLGGTNLGGANLGGANLGGANLGGANLANANLGGANLRGANLRGAYLGGANLANANLGGANLGGANLANVKDIIILGQPDSWGAFAWLFKDELQFRVGCQSKSLSEAKEYWSGKENRREVMAAINFAVTTAKIRGWDFKE